MKFETLFGHADAGYITFTGILDPETNTITFEIFNETRSNHGVQSISLKFDRGAQQDQWENVISNVAKYFQTILGKDFDKKSVKASEHIEEYNWNELDNNKGRFDWEDDSEIDWENEN